MENSFVFHTGLAACQQRQFADMMFQKKPISMLTPHGMRSILILKLKKVLLSGLDGR